MIVDGKKIAEEIMENLKKREKPKRFLAAFLVGEDPASLKFIHQKKKIARELNIDFRVYAFPENIKQDGLRKKIVKVGKHKTCGGMIVQLPLPDHINRHYVLNAIPREKDLDVLGERALGAFYTNRNSISPPSVEVVKEIMKRKELDLKKNVITVLGLGFLIGKPIAAWLSGQCPNLILLDKGGDMGLLKKADIVICGTGSPRIIQSRVLKEKAFVIDFGYSLEKGNIVGDFDPENSEVDYTPTPGGTGPVLVAKLFENFFILNG